MKSTYPGVDQNIIGEIPEIHATRVVGEMVGYLQAVSLTRIAQLTSAMNMPIGGSPKAQERWAQRIHKASIPMLADFATCWGKRARFSLSLSIWDMDEHGGATVNHYLATSQGPGTERRSRGPLWRICPSPRSRASCAAIGSDRRSQTYASDAGGRAARLGLDGRRQFAAGRQASPVREIPERDSRRGLASRFWSRRRQDRSRSRYGASITRTALALWLDGGPAPSSCRPSFQGKNNT